MNENDAASHARVLPMAPHQRLPRIMGQALERLPEDLYIPPDALEIFLEAFEGPLDLLLYLVRKQNLDITDVPVLQITRQYMVYIDLMEELKLELAAEYLVMAAWLAEIKSRILLPRPLSVEEDDSGDPRQELVRRLQEYERFKSAAEKLNALPRVGREIFLPHTRPEFVELERPLPVPGLLDLLNALQDVVQRAGLFARHEIQHEPLSVRDRMSRILDRLRDGPAVFADLFEPIEGRAGVVVAFLALLELVRRAVLEVHQTEPFEPLVLALVRQAPHGEAENV